MSRQLHLDDDVWFVVEEGVRYQRSIHAQRPRGEQISVVASSFVAKGQLLAINSDGSAVVVKGVGEP